MYKVIFNSQISNLNLRIFQRWNEHKYKRLKKGKTQRHTHNAWNKEQKQSQWHKKDARRTTWR
jgi:hypothetical protein